MKQRHYKDSLTQFVNHELGKNVQQEIAEHLMQCVACRTEHDRIKLGSSLAATILQTDAPERVWHQIENSLDARRSPQITMIPDGSFFGARNIAGYAVSVLLVSAMVFAAYWLLFRDDRDNTNRAVVNSPAKPDQESVLLPDTAAISAENPANINPSNLNVAADSNSAPASNIADPVLASGPAFAIETISGSPRVGPASSAGRLAVGDYLETDSASRARIQVADIGNVEIQPNSRVQLVGTNPNEHRLSLERGILQAQISAPPRLFIVDTPSAVAVDLGCAYRLEVDKAGNSYLHVTSGFVALERDGRESIVPAGAMCITRRGKGLGTPFSADTTDAFRKALERFDFSNGGRPALQNMLDIRSAYDIITLWHLVSRVPRADRDTVFDALAEYVPPPADVTRKGIRNLNKKMLAAWRAEVENVWFE